MAKAEISWKRVTEEGERLQVYAHHFGGAWIFYKREKRFDVWQEVKDAPLEDWMELLDAVRRRINRRKQKPVDAERIIKTIRERFPEAAVK